VYDGERADALVLDHLEAVLRHVAEELAAWRARAIKAEAELKEGGGRGGAGAKADPEVRGRVSDLEQENKLLRQRVEAARVRVQDLLSRLTFLEEQARQGGNGGAASAGGAGSAPGAVGAGGATSAGAAGRPAQ